MVVSGGHQNQRCLEVYWQVSSYNSVEHSLHVHPASLRLTSAMCEHFSRGSAGEGHSKELMCR